MKAPTTGPGGTFVIRSADQGKTWRVVELATHRLDSAEVRVVWTGASFQEARSRHAAAVLALPLRMARRLTDSHDPVRARSPSGAIRTAPHGTADTHSGGSIMDRQTITTARVSGDITGTFWYPIGEPWTVHGAGGSDVQRGRHDWGITLRDLVDAAVYPHAGDSSTACRFDRDSAFLVIRRDTYRDGRLVATRSRWWPLAACPSVADYLTD